MIKVGIIGGSNPMAGELLRLLINHPDVTIRWVDSARYTGRLVSDVHHGLYGETDLRISPVGQKLAEIDVLFIFRHRGQTIEWLDQHELPEHLRIVDLSVDMRDPDNAEKYGFVYGMPELNRKAMVRGATRAIVPHPAAIIAQLSLLPLAKEQALPDGGDIAMHVLMPQLGEQIDDPDAVAREITLALATLQPSLTKPIAIEAGASADDRAMSATITFDSTLDIGEILRMYEEFYDDHNFTFLVDQPLQAKEVAGTNKCLIRVEKEHDKVTVTSIMDALIKGASGTALHDMNLLFGLHERVGLALKASAFQ